MDMIQTPHGDIEYRLEGTGSRMNRLAKDELYGGRYITLPEMIKGIDAVTSDDLYTGTRWYWDLVDESLPPMDGIIQRYWAKLPCPARSMPRVRLAQVLEFLELGRGLGAIILTEKHCDPHIFDDPLLKSRLEERGIPCLQLESELALRGVGQFRTRLQTFVEMVRSGEKP